MDLLHTKLWFMCAGNKCEANLENNHKGSKRKTAKQKELEDWKKKVKPMQIANIPVSSLL